MTHQLDRARDTAQHLMLVAEYLAPTEPIGVSKQEWSDLWAYLYHLCPGTQPEHPVHLLGHPIVRCPNVTFVTNT